MGSWRDGWLLNSYLCYLLGKNQVTWPGADRSNVPNRTQIKTDESLTCSQLQQGMGVEGWGRVDGRANAKVMLWGHPREPPHSQNRPCPR